MLVRECLTKKIREKLSDKICSCGFCLADCIRSGEANPDGHIGVYAGCSECYNTFSSLLRPIIEKYHDFSFKKNHRSDFSSRNLRNMPPLGDFIVSVRVRVGRNLRGYPFGATINMEQRLEAEDRISKTVQNFRGDLRGKYFPLPEMEEKIRQKLVSDHFLFREGDRFQEAAGLNRDWPRGRGIFLTQNKKFLLWINEEDHLRIISMEKGGDVLSVARRLFRALRFLEKDLDFASSKQLGFLTSCPSNLGTAMRVSVHMKLEKLSLRPDFKQIVRRLGLSARGIDGEFSNSPDRIYDISNTARLGMTEIEIIEQFYRGTEELIRMEKELK